MTLRTTLTAIVAAIALMAPAASSRAQGKLDRLKGTTPTERAKVQTEVMTEKLGLTAEQAPKISAINLKYAEKMEPIIQGKEPPFARMRQMKEINEQKEGELKSVLTAEQFQKYLAGKEQRREKLEAKMMERLRSGGPAAE
jgi:Spy/CpxP family protein refolding chaperone